MLRNCIVLRSSNLRTPLLWEQAPQGPEQEHILLTSCPRAEQAGNSQWLAEPKRRF